MLPETGRAYVPIFGDGIHGRNPNPGHTLHVIDLHKRSRAADIDLRPYIAPHTLKLGPDGLIYITCENSAVVAIIDPATNKVVGAIELRLDQRHRLIISPDGQRLYTENEEDATISVIDLPARKLIGKIKTPHPLAGIAISADGDTIIAVDDAEPNLFLIDAATESIRTLPLRGRAEGRADRALPRRFQPARRDAPEQRHGQPDRSILHAARPRSRSAASRWTWRSAATSCSSAARATARCMSSTFRRETGRASFRAGTGCESLGFF